MRKSKSLRSSGDGRHGSVVVAPDPTTHSLPSAAASMVEEEGEPLHCTLLLREATDLFDDARRVTGDDMQAVRLLENALHNTIRAEDEAQRLLADSAEAQRLQGRAGQQLYSPTREEQEQQQLQQQQHQRLPPAQEAQCAATARGTFALRATLAQTLVLRYNATAMKQIRSPAVPAPPPANNNKEASLGGADYPTAVRMLETAQSLCKGSLSSTTAHSNIFHGHRLLQKQCHSTTLNNYGCLERRRGNLDAAVELLRKSINVAGAAVPSVPALLNLSAVYAQQHRHHDAVRQARMAVEILSTAIQERRYSSRAGDDYVVDGADDGDEVPTRLLVCAHHNLAIALEPQGAQETLQHGTARNSAIAAFDRALDLCRSVASRERDVAATAEQQGGNAETTEDAASHNPMYAQILANKRRFESYLDEKRRNFAQPLGGDEQLFLAKSIAPHEEMAGLSSLAESVEVTEPLATASTRASKGRVRDAGGKVPAPPASGAQEQAAPRRRQSNVAKVKGDVVGQQQQQQLLCGVPAPPPKELVDLEDMRKDDVVAYVYQRLGLLLRQEADFDRRYYAAVRIQCLARRMAARQTFAAMARARARAARRRLGNEEWAGNVVIRFFARILDNKHRRAERVRQRRLRHERQEWAAVTIQKTMRMYLGKQEAHRVRRKIRHYHASVGRLQAWMRRMLACLCAARMAAIRQQRSGAKQRQEVHDTAAAQVQRIYRGHRARIRVLLLRGNVRAALEKDRQKLTRHAATRVQAAWRRYLVRRSYGRQLFLLKKRRVVSSRTQQRRAASTVIQALFRGFRVRNVTHEFVARHLAGVKREQLRARSSAAATKIQCLARRAAARTEYTARLDGKHRLVAPPPMPAGLDYDPDDPEQYFSNWVSRDLS